jgi:tetratricopeptide (TPR) repeat protein
MQILHAIVTRHAVLARRTLPLWLAWGVLSVVVLADAPTTPDRSAEINRWVEQLGHSNYFVRQKAQDELARVGFEAFDALTAAAIHDDLEIAARARYLLRLIRVEWTVESDSAEVKRLLADYEKQSPEGRFVKMKALAAAPGGMAALCRLVRFEQSVLLSKHAAIEILTHSPAIEPPSERLAALLRGGLSNSRQPASRWLLTYLRFRDDPVKALAAWKGLIEAEQAVLQRAPNQTDIQVIAALFRFQVNWLEKLNRNEEAVRVVRQLIDLEPGDADTLAELVDWLLEKKAWQAIDDVATRFANRIHSDAKLIYALAEVQAARGNKQRAEEMAEQARKLRTGKDEETLAQHVDTATYLSKRGLFSWAEREYRDAIAAGSYEQEAVIAAALFLSDMLHDMGDDLRAAQARQEAVNAMVKFKISECQFGRLDEIRSRMHCYYAYHWERKGDFAAQRKALDAALQADPPDVDALIACYHLPHSEGDYRRKIVDLIRKSARQKREQIDENPDDYAARNEFAWLIGNTEGDYDEAVKQSQISIELRPDTGGFYDTLAHCYYAKGDYENAVKYQTKAVEFEPHSGLIVGKLRVFRQALAGQKAKDHSETHQAQRH